MTRVESFNPHRWIIFHVAFIIQSKVNAQSLTPSPPDFQTGQNTSKTTVSAVLVTIFFAVGLLSVYIRHCIRSNPEYSGSYFHRGANDGCSRRGGLDNAVVESFPVFAYSSVKESIIGSGHLECAICLNELEDRETVRLLPICNHLFHIDCIDAWLYSHATCPVCRSNLTAKSVKTAVEDDGPQLAENHVTIDIETVEADKSHHRRPSSEIAGKFPRSNSTGHSIGRFSDGTERYTLRLPDDVKRRIMAAKGRRLKRTRSFDADLTAECRGEFCRSGEESSNNDVIGSGVKFDWVYWADRWGLYATKSNSDSVSSQTSNGEPVK
ncbi:RING-H2 finger protein ATL32 [Cardamine amara subsp. amara]|uniref:RING-type E3 ubiquitin transferase n=1 Tax=Cardamine amara subsp. amara TaxID=228776 RepID=A0ABD0ZGN5_CARAN